MKIQVALDTVSLGEGIKIVSEVEGHIDFIEIGTPMIFRYGLQAVTEMKRAYPHHKIVFDGKIADAGYYEAMMAFEAGADIVTVLAVSDDATILSAVRAAKECDKKVLADLIHVPNIGQRAKELIELEVDYIGIHIGVDTQKENREFDSEFTALEGIVSSEKIAVAGGINPDLALKIKKYNPGVVIVGGFLAKAKNKEQAVLNLKKNLKER